MGDRGDIRQNLNRGLKVCLMGGAGHSGSTLLGLILGSHSQGFYAGEAAKTRYLHHPQTVLRKRSCKFCGLDCPVWGDFVIHPEQNLYVQIAQRVNRSFIIDSTKNIDWLQQQAQGLQNLNIPFFFIFLKRDGRAVVNSRLRKYPDRASELIIEEWKQQIQQTQAFFEGLTTPKLMLSYEELATEPSRVTQRLCEFLHLDYEEEMLNYNQQAHHVLGGNNGTQFLVAQSQQQPFPQANPSHSPSISSNHDYYLQHYQRYGAKIHIDLRWKTELPDTVQTQLKSLAAAECQFTQWES